MDNGLALIVSGPSGSGKDTILRKLFESHPEIKFSIDFFDIIYAWRNYYV